MTKNLLFLFAICFSIGQAQVASAVYYFDSLSEKITNAKAETRTYFKSSSRDFKTLQMEAVLFKKTRQIQSTKQ